MSGFFKDSKPTFSLAKHVSTGEMAQNSGDSSVNANSSMDCDNEVKESESSLSDTTRETTREITREDSSRTDISDTPMRKFNPSFTPSIGIAAQTGLAPRGFLFSHQSIAPVTTSGRLFASGASRVSNNNEKSPETIIETDKDEPSSADYNEQTQDQHASSSSANNSTSIELPVTDQRAAHQPPPRIHQQPSSPTRGESSIPDDPSKMYFSLITSLDAKCKNLESEVSQLTIELTNKETQLTKTKSVLGNTFHNSKKISTTLKNLNADMVVLQKDRTRLSHELVTVKDVNEANQIKIHNLKENVSRIVKKLNSYQPRFTELRDKFQKEILNSSNLKNLVDEMSGKLSEEKLKSSNLEKQVVDLTDKYHNAIVTLTETFESNLSEGIITAVSPLLKANTIEVRSQLISAITSCSEKSREEISSIGESVASHIRCSSSFFDSAQEQHTSILQHLSQSKVTLDDWHHKYHRELANISQSITDLKAATLDPNFSALTQYSKKAESMLAETTRTLTHQSTVIASFQSDVNKKLKEAELIWQQQKEENLTLKEEMANMTKSRVKLETENGILNERLKETADLMAQERATFRQIEQSHKEQLATISEEKFEVTAKLESSVVSHKHVMSAVDAERAELKSKLCELELKLRSSESCHRDLTSLKYQYQALIEEKSNLESKLEKLVRDYSELESVNKSLKTASSKLEAQSDAIRLSNIRNEQALDATKTRLEEVQAESSKAKEIQHQERILMDSLRARLVGLESIVKETSRKLSISESSGKNDKAAYEAILSDLKKSSKKDQALIADLQKSKVQLETDNAKLEQNYTQELELNRKIEAQLDKLNGELLQSKKELKELVTPLKPTDEVGNSEDIIHDVGIREEKKKSCTVRFKYNANPASELTSQKPMTTRAQMQSELNARPKRQSSSQKTAHVRSSSMKPQPPSHQNEEQDLQKKSKRRKVVADNHDDFSFENLDSPPKRSRKYMSTTGKKSVG